SCWTYSAPNGVPTLSILAPSGWAGNTVYSVTLSPGIADAFGFQTTTDQSTFFVTAPVLDPNSSVVNNVVSPLDTTQLATVGVPANALPAGGFVVPRVLFKNPASPLTTGAAALGITSQGAFQIYARAEVDIYRCNATADPTCGPRNSDRPLTVRILAPGAASG